jgi:hypothetical protein
LAAEGGKGLPDGVGFEVFGALGFDFLDVEPSAEVRGALALSFMTIFA